MPMNIITIPGRLKELGAEEEITDAVVSEILIFQDHHPATKADVAELIAATKADVADLKADLADLKAEIAEFKAEIKADLARLEKKLDIQFYILTALSSAIFIMLLVDKL